MNKLHEKIILFLPVPVFLICLVMGSYDISLKEIIDILVYRISGHAIFSNVLNQNSITVLIDVRLPRVLLSMIVGASLSVSGASFQAVLRNPLVDPYILGLSSGAAFGAALSMAFIGIPVQISSFIFALISVSVCYMIARFRGEISTISLILAGVIVSSVFTALLSIIQIMVDPLRLQGMVYWVMGSFHTSSWDKLISSLPYMMIGFIILYIMRWRLNILSYGDKEAKILGLNPEKNKILVILASTLLASSAVAVSGIISLVGLMIPHILRMISGPDNKKIIPLSMCLGASYLALVDNLSRNLFTYEIPIGIFTTLLGAPFFIILLRKTKAGGWN